VVIFLGRKWDLYNTVSHVQIFDVDSRPIDMCFYLCCVLLCVFVYLRVLISNILFCIILFSLYIYYIYYICIHIYIYYIIIYVSIDPEKKASMRVIQMSHGLRALGRFSAKSISSPKGPKKSEKAGQMQCELIVCFWSMVTWHY